MNLNKQLTLFTHLLALTGFLAVSLTNDYGLVILAVYIGVLLLSLFYDLRDNSYLLGRGLNNLVSILIAVYLIAELTLFGAELFNVCIHFILVIQIVKFLGKKELKDYKQIILISFFQVLAGAATTTQISFGALLLLFIFFSIAVVVLFNIINEFTESKGKVRVSKIKYVEFFSSVGAIWVVILLISIMIFLTMPRFKGNYISASFIKKELIRTGFNDQVELGKVGEIKLDSSPVMRVKFLNIDKKDLPKILYWRGVALDYFDGKSWSQSEEVKVSKFRKQFSGLIVVDTENKINPAKQEIITQPLDTDVVFAADRPVAFKDIPYNRIWSVNDSYYHDGLFSKNTKYLAYSDIYEPDVNLLINGKYTVPEEIMYLYGRKLNSSEKISELADELYNPELSVYENAENIRIFLIDNLNYTRVLDQSTSKPPLEQFLFENKEGHCEYFASSMVILLREMGIPSRLVTGFMGGQYNDLGNYFLIRESDAHAWVEVYFPTHGWVIFDPTPADSTQLYSINMLLTSFEYLRYRWNKYIIDFDQKDQDNLLGSLRNSADRYKYIASGKFNLNRIKLSELVFASVILIVGLIYVRKLSIKNILIRRSHTEYLKIYNNSLKLIKKDGHVKSECHTTTEFSNYLIGINKYRYREFNELTNNFNKIKYGGLSERNYLHSMKESYNKLKKIISEK